MKYENTNSKSSRESSKKKIPYLYYLLPILLCGHLIWHMMASKRKSCYKNQPAIYSSKILSQAIILVFFAWCMLSKLLRKPKYIDVDIENEIIGLNDFIPNDIWLFIIIGLTSLGNFITSIYHFNKYDKYSLDCDNNYNDKYSMIILFTSVIQLLSLILSIYLLHRKYNKLTGLFIFIYMISLLIQMIMILTFNQKNCYSYQGKVERALIYLSSIGVTSGIMFILFPISHYK